MPGMPQRRIVIGAVLAVAIAAPAREASHTAIRQAGRIPAHPPGTPDHDYTFFATDIVLAHYGYVEGVLLRRHSQHISHRRRSERHVVTRGTACTRGCWCMTGGPVGSTASSSSG
jgi:hypothetical protein